jgi:hypothetical protein
MQLTSGNVSSPVVTAMNTATGPILTVTITRVTNSITGFDTVCGEELVDNDRSDSCLSSVVTL